MRKITMIAACVALAQTAWAGKPVPYSTPIADDADWQIVNAQEGSNTWITESTSDNTGYDTKKVMYYKYDWSFAADDWLISPAISLEGGKEYKVKIRCKISDQEIVRIFMGSGNTPEDLKPVKSYSIKMTRYPVSIHGTLRYSSSSRKLPETGISVSGKVVPQINIMQESPASRFSRMCSHRVK